MSTYGPINFEKFARRCPLCGGCVYRDFTILEKVCFFLPFHLILKAKHHCDWCEARFTSAHNLTDYIFVGLFGLAIYMLGEDWVASLIVLAIWLCVSLVKPKGPVGPFHTFIAAIILSTLWFVVLVLKVRLPPQFMHEHGDLLFGLSAATGYCFSYGMLYLDRISYGTLTTVKRRS